MMRMLAMFTSAAGLLLCLGAGGTGIWWGMGHADIRDIHLKLAISCVGVSLVAHTLALTVLKKSK